MIAPCGQFTDKPDGSCSPKVGELRAAVRGMNKTETTNSSLISLRRKLYPSRVHYIILYNTLLIRYISSIRVPPFIYFPPALPLILFHTSALFMFLSSFPAKSLSFPMCCMCFCVCLQSARWKVEKNLSLFSWAVKCWALRGSQSFASLCYCVLLYFFTKTFGHIAGSSYFCTRKWGQGRMSERKRSVLWNTYITFSREVQDQENRPHCLEI